MNLDSETERLLTESQEEYLNEEHHLSGEHLLDFFGTAEDPNLMPLVYDFPLPKMEQMVYEEPKCLQYPAAPGCATGMLPSIESFPGSFNFAIDISALESEKGWSWSTRLNKAFITLKNRIPITFKWLPTLEDLNVRALMVYDHPNDFRLPIKRCPLHIGENSKDVYSDHVIHADHPSAFYDMNHDSDRRSVLVPLDRAQPGATSVTVHYILLCKNSCPGGLNRRATSIIFTLESVTGEVVGRQTVGVRICSCPKRDKDKEELNCQDNSNERGVTPGSKKRLMKTHGSNNKKVKKNDRLYTLEILGEEDYQFALVSMYNRIVGRAALEERPLTDAEKHLMEKYKSKMLNL